MAATLATRLHAHFAPLHDQPTPDADLLARFALHGDSGAFAALVKRHGGMVSAVCRKRLGHAQDAEDAAQAVFLALARKADRVHGTAPVAAWLYGAAVKACREVARRNRRKPWVPLTADVPGDTALSADPEAVAAVLDEVANLSDAHRAAVVLCELEGCPRGLAARRLGIAEGTLSSRLAAARRRLADRLTRRGFAPSALAALTGLAVGSPSFAFDLPSVTPIVQRITEAIVTTSIAWKLKLCAALGATTATLGLAFAGGEEPKPTAPPTPVAAKVAEPKPANFVLASHTNGYCPADKKTNVPPALKMTQVTPDGVATPVGGPDVNGIMNALHNVAVGTPKTASYIEFDRLTNAISPDGRTAMFESFTAPAKSEFRNMRGRGIAALVTAEGRVKKLGDTGEDAPCLVWTADGQTLFTSVVATLGFVTFTPPFVHMSTSYVTTRIDTRDLNVQGVQEIAGGRPIAASPDGKSLLVVLTKESYFSPATTSLWLASLNPQVPNEAATPAKLKLLVDWSKGADYEDAAFSPDGKQIVVSSGRLVPYPKRLMNNPPADPKVVPCCLSKRYQIIDIASQRITPFDYVPECDPSYGRGAVWSPDGTRVAILDAKRWTRDADGMHAVEPQAITFDLAGRKLSGTPLPVGDAEPYGAQFHFGPRLIGWR